MSTPRYVRLRQICLATLELPKHEQALSRIFGLNPCHKSKLDEFGLENSLFAINGTFIELVAPTTKKTAVHRFLSRSNGVGGYMAIFDCDAVSARKAAAAKLGIDPVYEKSYPAADLLQLNPRQTGLTLVEFDHHQEGEDLHGAYEWAGKDWQKGINTELVKDMTSLTFSCADPQARAEQWSPLFGKALIADAQTVPALPLDYGTLYFTQSDTKSPDHFSGVQITATDPETILKNAEKSGYPVSGATFYFCGIKIEILAA